MATTFVIDDHAAAAHARGTRGAALQPVANDEALAATADRLAHVVLQHGPAALGVIVSGWIGDDCAYAFGKLARRLVGTKRIASTSQLGSAAACAAWQAALGAPPRAPSVDDVAAAQTVFIAGANPALTQPQLFARIAAARAQGTKVIVADPRRTATADAADLHLALLPGTDVVLLHAMLHLLLWEGFADPAWIRQHTTGFEALRDVVREFTPAQAAKSCGLKAEAIVQAARWFGAGGATLSIAGQGLNQAASGADRIASLVNLHLATGTTHAPGSGPRLLQGQPRRHDFGVATSVGDIVDAAARGEVKALWVVGADPLRSLPDAAAVRRAFEAADLVVVQDRRSDTLTAECADVVLQPQPGSGEDWRIAAAVARRLERLLRERAPAPAAFVDPRWGRGRPGDADRPPAAPMFDWGSTAELASERIAAAAVAAAASPGAAAQLAFAAPKWRPTAEVRDARHPWSLLSSRSASAEPRVEVHPQELARRRWRAGDVVRVATKRGELLLPVHADDRISPTQAFVATGAHAVGSAGVNVLIGTAACTRSRQAELKHAAARIERVELPWQIAAAAWLPANAATATLPRLHAALAPLAFASVVPLPAAHGEAGWIVRAAHAAAVPEVIGAVESALQLDAVRLLRYADPRSGRHRAMQLGGDGALRAFVLGGETAARDWMLDLLVQRRSAAAYGRALLAAAAAPPWTTP